jgi:hypothetical protein
MTVISDADGAGPELEPDGEVDEDGKKRRRPGPAPQPA